MFQEASRNSGQKAAAILFTALFAGECLLLSGLKTFSVGGLIAFLALLTSLGLLFVRTVDWARQRALALPAAVIAVAVYGVHPATFAALNGTVDWNLIASLAGVSCGIAICRWNADRSWQIWVSLLPVAPCIILHRAGIAFAPLLAVSIWLFPNQQKPLRPLGAFARWWPALAVSVVAAAVNRGSGFSLGFAVARFPGTMAAFAIPFSPSLSGVWSVAAGVISVAAVGMAALAAVFVFNKRAAAFGLFWFLLMALIVPAQPLAAFPGFALTLVAIGVVVFAPVLESRALLPEPEGVRG